MEGRAEGRPIYYISSSLGSRSNARRREGWLVEKESTAMPLS